MSCLTLSLNVTSAEVEQLTHQSKLGSLMTPSPAPCSSPSKTLSLFITNYTQRSNQWPSSWPQELSKSTAQVCLISQFSNFSDGPGSCRAQFPCDKPTHPLNVFSPEHLPMSILLQGDKSTEGAVCVQRLRPHPFWSLHVASPGTSERGLCAPMGMWTGVRPQLLSVSVPLLLETLST